jgi:hypothetical protein
MESPGQVGEEGGNRPEEYTVAAQYRQPVSG